LIAKLEPKAPGVEHPDTLRDWIGVALDHAGPELIEVCDHAWLGRAGDQFPVTEVDQWGFECRLGAKASQTDFGVGISFDRADFIGAWCPPTTGTSTGSFHRVWQRIQALAAAEPKNDASQPKPIRMIWLEFDRPRELDALAAPILFVVPQFGQTSPQVGLGGQISDHRSSDTMATIREIVALLSDVSNCGESQLRDFEQCLGALPSIDGGSLLLGSLAGRSSPCMRFVGALRPAALVPFLRQVGVEDIPVSLPGLMGEFEGVLDAVGVHLDIGSGIGPTIGVELLGVRRGAVRLEQTMSILQRHGLCTAAKRAAVLRWRGKTAVDRGEEPPGTLYHWINHLKIVFRESGDVEAKTYLALAAVTSDARRRHFPFGNSSASPLRKAPKRQGSMRHFHRPERNNFVHIWLRSDIDPEQHWSSFRGLFLHLNQADHELLKFITAHWAVRLAAEGGVAEALARWAHCQSTRANLRGVDHASIVIRAIDQQLGADGFGHHLQMEYPELTRSFIDLPDEITDAHRINLSLPHAESMRCFTSVIARIDTDEHALQVLEKVEIANPTFQTGGTVDYPTVIFYLRPNQVENQKGVENLVEAIAASLDEFPTDHRVAQDFSDCWRPNASATHGYRLHKRYLSLLGLLDHVFEAQTRYAYRPDIVSLFPEVFDRYRR